MITLCKELGIFTQDLDQILFYLEKITHKRQDNTIIATAKSLIRTTECKSLQSTMEQISGIILNHNNKGLIPRDPESPITHFMWKPSQSQLNNNASRSSGSRTPKLRNRGNNRRPNRSQNAGNKQCFHCAQDYELLSQHLRSCPARGYTCSTCSLKGHTETACAPYKQQRIEAAKIRRQQQNGHNYTGSKNRGNSSQPQEDPQPQTHFNVEGTPTVTSVGPTPLQSNEYTLFGAETPLLDTLRAGVDTCSSCNILNDLAYFESLVIPNTQEPSIC